MLGLFYILLFWLIGNALSILTGGYVSGNIIGMILLFAALCMRWVKAETVRPAARTSAGPSPPPLICGTVENEKRIPNKNLL